MIPSAPESAIPLTESQELRPGAIVDSPALVLAAIRYQETGKIVHLLTPAYGKIHVFAPGAVLSRKRFGAALEPMSFVTAQLRFPRQTGHGEALIQILKADLRDSFLHLRTSSSLLETGAFAVRLIDEFIPEHQADAQIFRATGRFLRDSARLERPDLLCAWGRFAFWNWMSRHFGFGDLRESMGDLLPALPQTFDAAWMRLMNETEPDFTHFFMALGLSDPPALTRRDEAVIYGKWTETTGIHWPNFEKWLKVDETQF